MIVGVGSQRTIDWWNPLVAVAGDRAYEQLGFMQADRENLIERLGVTAQQFDGFMSGWALPLSEWEADTGISRRGCNCRGTEAKRGYETSYAVLNLVDILDIICNIGAVGFFFEGATEGAYSGQGRMDSLLCRSCGGWFSGLVFDGAWGEKTGERERPPVFWLLSQDIPFTPLTRSWLYADWTAEAQAYSAIGVDERGFTDAVVEFGQGRADRDTVFGTGWEPSKGWSASGLSNRYDMWIAAGASHNAAVIGLLLERVTHQSTFAKPPSRYAVDAVTDPSKRDLLLRAIDRYAADLKQRPLVGLEKAVAFEVIVQMGINSVDPEFLGILRGDSSY